MTATSKKLYTTRYARGTSSYRAPELVHERSTFNNKVDIWAAGCILFEVVFAKKAFTNDHAVQDYESNTSFYGTGFKMPERTDIQLDMRSISSIIQQTFSTAPSNRPSAKELLVSLDAAFAEDEEELMSDMSTTTEEEVETRVDTPPPQMRESTLVRKYYLMVIDTPEPPQLIALG
jgi:serine/threonine protein kinase